MNEYPKCPKCGEELEPWRWDDFWAEDNNCVSAYVRGFCPKCHKPYGWTETYKYIEFSDLEADED